MKSTLTPDEIVAEAIRVLTIERECWPNGNPKSVTMCPGVAGIGQRYYENGKLHEEWEVDADGLMQGFYRNFYVNGDPRTEIALVDGQRHGPECCWYTGKRLFHKDNYVGGQREGMSTTWYKNGTKVHEFSFFAGKEHGKANSWHPNGVLRSECSYSSGKKEGVYRSWFSKGQSHVVATFKVGRPVSNYREWRRNGTLIIEAEYSDDHHRIGTERQWYPNGQLKEEVFRSQTAPYRVIGTHTWWNLDGTIKAQISHKN